MFWEEGGGEGDAREEGRFLATAREMTPAKDVVVVVAVAVVVEEEVTSSAELQEAIFV